MYYKVYPDTRDTLKKLVQEMFAEFLHQILMQIRASSCTNLLV